MIGTELHKVATSELVSMMPTILRLVNILVDKTLDTG